MVGDRGIERTEASRLQWVVFTIAASAVFMMTLDSTLQPIALGSIGRSFEGSSTTALSWVLTSYNIAIAGLVVASGRIADRVGRRQTFLVGLLVFVVGSLGGALAPDLWVLVAFRVLQGTGAAFVIPSSLGLILAAWPAGETTRAITTWTAVGGLAGAVGPTLGAAIVGGPGWRVAYLMNVVVGLVAWTAGRRLLIDTARRADASFPDLLGAVLVSVCLGSATLVLVQGRSWGITDWRILVSLAVAVTLAPVVRHRSVHHPAPILDLSLFHNRVFRRVLAVSVVVPAYLFAHFVMMIQFLGDIWGYSEFGQGLGILPFPVAATAATLLAGRMAKRFDERDILLTGMVMSTASVLWFYLVVGQEPAYWSEFLPAVLLGGVGGWGVSLGMMNAIGAGALNDETYGLGVGLLSTIRQVGGLIGIATAFGILGEVVDDGLYDRYREVYLALTVLSAVSIFIAARIPRRPEPSWTQR